MVKILTDNPEIGLLLERLSCARDVCGYCAGRIPGYQFIDPRPNEHGVFLHRPEPGGSGTPMGCSASGIYKRHVLETRRIEDSRDNAHVLDSATVGTLPEFSWVRCPVCKEDDMPAERDGEPGDGGWIVTCSNLACPSNISDDPESCQSLLDAAIEQIEPARVEGPITVEQILRCFPPEAIAPIPMILFCLRCGARHIDKPNLEKQWTNPPHRSHECQQCGFVWRQSDLPTTGAERIATYGKADTWIDGSGLANLSEAPFFDVKSSMPWAIPPLDKWSLCSMNHYRVNGTKYLFVAMSHAGMLIQAEGQVEGEVFKSLVAQAKKAEASRRLMS